MVAEYLDKNYDRVSDTPYILDTSLMLTFKQKKTTSSSYLLQLLSFRQTT